MPSLGAFLFPARGLAGPRRAARRGCGIPRQSAVVAGFGGPPAAEHQSAAQEGKDTGGAHRVARGSGAPAASGDGFEDAHWIDPTSREVLDLTVERVRSLPVLQVATFRPEFQPPWTGQPQVTMLALNRLDRRDRTVLVEQIAGGKALPDEVIDQIVDRTDGVPLFVEELTKSVLESGVTPLGIPTSLHDSLMARLDRLAASVRLVAQIGAAIGREFPYALVQAVSRLPVNDLQAALARLVASELGFQRGT